MMKKLRLFTKKKVMSSSLPNTQSMSLMKKKLSRFLAEGKKEVRERLRLRLRREDEVKG